MFIVFWSWTNSCSYIHTTVILWFFLRDMPYGSLVQELPFDIHNQSIYTAQLLNCGHSSNKVLAFSFTALQAPHSGIIWHQLPTIFTIKGIGRKGTTLNVFKTHSPFQPCQLPRQTSLSGFCCRSSQWAHPISCTWRRGKTDQLA